MEFFRISIARSRLTPQAVMVFFSPESQDISETDRVKIRRLILNKLFIGWQLDVKNTLKARYRASAILARCMRRTNTQLWAKEVVLMTFHMWKRYHLVYRAFQYDEPVPRFTLPYIAEWGPLFKSMTMKHLKKNRALLNRDKLLTIRWWKAWLKLMTLDKSALLTPDELAEKHHQMQMKRKFIIAWYQVLSERGEIVRIRDKAFRAWKIYAPRRKRFRNLTKDISDWQLLCVKAKAYRAMSMSCKDVIERRTYTLRRIRERISDRKFLICVYALNDKNAHVIFYDCWRRWRKWIHLKSSWRSCIRQVRFIWQGCKIKTIFLAWKYYIHPDLKPNDDKLKDVDIKDESTTTTTSSHSNVKKFSFITHRKEDLKIEDHRANDRVIKDLCPDISKQFLEVIQSTKPEDHMHKLNRELFLFLCRAQASNNKTECSEDNIIYDQQNDILHVKNVKYPLLHDMFLEQEAKKNVFVKKEEKEIEERYNKITEQLQNSIDNLDVSGAIKAIEDGARVVILI